MYIAREKKNAGSFENSRLPAHPTTGDERIELPLKVLETSVIPFDQSPTFDISFRYTFKTAYTFCTSAIIPYFLSEHKTWQYFFFPAFLVKPSTD